MSILIIIVIIILFTVIDKRKTCQKSDHFVADFPRTDVNYPKTMLVGEYGGVPLYRYDFEDDLYHDQWRGFASGSYVLNTKKQWLKTDTPREMALWAEQIKSKETQ
jgi:hypothetical protein